MRTLALAFSAALMPLWAFAAPPNQAPTIAPIAPQTINENQTLTVEVVATDPDGDGVSLSASGLPTGASFVDNGGGSGTLSFKPNFEQAGGFTVTVTAVDSGVPAEVVSLDVDITVVNVNRPPIINAQGSLDAVVGQTVTASFAALDPDGDQVVFSGVDLPGDMTVINSGNSSAVVEFTPTAAEVGSVTVFINADDGSQISAIPLEVNVQGLPVEDSCAVSHSGASSTAAFWGLLLGVWLLRRRANS